MERIIASLLMLCCMATTSSIAENQSDQSVDFQIISQGNVDTPIYRSPSIIPVNGYYSKSIGTLYLSFAYDLGAVNVFIENETTGKFLNMVIPTDSGIQPIYLGNMGHSGIHTIKLSTHNGLQYIAYLEL